MTQHTESMDSTADDRSFTGFRRPDGRLGVRNNVLVIPSVICSHMVADEIAARADHAVSTPHDHGCAQLGADNDQTRETLLGVGSNPNVAGSVIVGLGCEHVQSHTVAGTLEDRGYPVREVAIQKAGGTDVCIDQGVSAVAELASHVAESTRHEAPLSELTIGIVSSDLDDSTIETADPLAGELASRLVSAGGRVVVAGNERFVAHSEETSARATADAQDTVAAFLETHDRLPARARAVYVRARELGFAESTGILGGLPIRDVIAYGERARHDTGLALVDSPSRFEEAATGLAAAGAHIVVHVTADGIPTGHPTVPILKVSANADTLDALPNDIDIDARTADVDYLTDRVRAVASGDRTCAERHGITEFAITRIGPSM